MSKYIMRLDDACEKRNIENWDRIEKILDLYQIKPLVGIIPDCKDPMMEEYQFDDNFWNRADQWKKKGWAIALHGYQHVYTTEDGGLNPVNSRSEFAGETLDIQRDKIKKGYNKLITQGIDPMVFFAPSHTFDENTLTALRKETNIRIISDTVANKPYQKYGFTFVPQQSGRCRKLPFKVVTFCYHPNTMSENDFNDLENFLTENSKKFIDFPLNLTNNKKSLFDVFLSQIYFLRRK